ncbi:hypothetical protein K9B35_02410 [Sphingomonas sp. R647]|uniref:GspMb/PilO family protein n=1 Tax=Sphingomonas sp. R647 TaxID=2875233 RepID=UPI001CD7FA9D|nr:GspMb/PilO family protein [Sphingomonas sp. R647]MCA1196808.1 hypothetical protein [Sphingomonas sp. R647]
MRRGSVAMGLGGGLVAVALLAFPALDALEALWSARQTRADLTASLAAPRAPVRPLVAPGLAIAAADRASAARSLAGRIRASAASAGVLVEVLSSAPSQSGIVTLRVRLSGPEKAVVAMLDGMERGTPLTRFRSWRASALADGGVRVEGEMVAAWQ